MRKCLSLDGLTDNSAALLAYLQSGPARDRLLVAHGFLLRPNPIAAGRPPGSVGKLYLTDWETPLLFDNSGIKFVPAAIKISGIETLIGLEASVADLEFTPDPSQPLTQFAQIVDGSNNVIQNLYQAMIDGSWNNGQVQVYRSFMPTPGDTGTFGSILVYCGKITDVVMDRRTIKIKATSPLEVLSQQLPPHVIERTDTIDAEIGPSDGSISSPFYYSAFNTVTVGATPLLIVGDETAPNAGVVEPDGTFDGQAVLFRAPGGSTLPDFVSRRVWHSFGANGHNNFQLYKPFPFSLPSGSTFRVFQPYSQVQASLGNNTLAFPYVPVAEDGL